MFTKNFITDMVRLDFDRSALPTTSGSIVVPSLAKDRHVVRKNVNLTIVEPRAAGFLSSHLGSQLIDYLRSVGNKNGNAYATTTDALKAVKLGRFDDELLVVLTIKDGAFLAPERDNVVSDRKMRVLRLWIASFGTSLSFSSFVDDDGTLKTVAFALIPNSSSSLSISGLPFFDIIDNL